MSRALRLVVGCVEFTHADHSATAANIKRVAVRLSCVSWVTMIGTIIISTSAYTHRLSPEVPHPSILIDLFLHSGLAVMAYELQRFAEVSILHMHPDSQLQ